jgi:hypothetical protein
MRTSDLQFSSSNSHPQTNLYRLLGLHIKPVSISAQLHSHSHCFYMASSSSSSSPEISPGARTETQQPRFSYKNATHEEVLEDLSRFITRWITFSTISFLFQPLYPQSPRS